MIIRLTINLLFTCQVVVLIAAGQQQQQQPQVNVQNEASINLKQILEHQQALASECQQFETIKLRQLKQVAQFDQSNDQVHLLAGQPMAVKLPAVCLFLFGPPGAQNEPPVASQEPRLDLVNWIYEPNELSQTLETKRSDNMTKRQAVDTVDANLIDANLNDYLYDLSEAQSAVGDKKEDNKQLEEFHSKVNNMIQDDRFHQAIESSRDTLLANYLSPVILVPGLLGSRLQARYSKTYKVNIFCTKQQADWSDMWLSLRLMLPLAVDCWLDNVRLEFDPSTGFTRAPKGVEARVPDFGSVESVRHLDLKSPKVTSYFNPLIERYEQMGYVPGRNLFAAPYDFRLAPQQLEANYFVDLKELIEQAASQFTPSTNTNRGTTLVCHSMGCTHLLVFLRKQSAAWRQSKVRKVIALSSPWAGTAKALKALVVGDQLDLPLVSEAKMRKLARTYPSIAYLLPHKEVFGLPNKDKVDFGGPTLVQVGAKKQYKVNEMEQLLKDIGLDQQLRWFQETSSLIKPLEPLADVQVDCIHSLNIPTPETLIFRNTSDFPDGNYELVNGQGDGTVNQQSLLVCADWAKKLPDKVRHKVIMNTNHLGLLSHPQLLTHLTDDVMMN